LCKLNLVNAIDNFSSVDMSVVSEGSEGSECCEVGDCSDISHVF